MITLNQHPAIAHHHQTPTKKLFYQTPHLLMIEDSLLVQYAQTHVLERLGCRVTVVDQGALGIAFAKNNPIDGIILDMELPDMHGTEVARAIRHDNHHLPIVVCSTELVDLVLYPEINHALQKPMRIDTVYTVLSELLSDRFLVPLQ